MKLKDIGCYYLVYFMINEDGDFYIEHYNDLNYDYAIFDNLNDAVNAVKSHIKLATDTFRTSKHHIDYVKEHLEDIYYDLLTYGVKHFKTGKYQFYVKESYGNYDVHYFIKKVPLMTSKEVR